MNKLQVALWRQYCQTELMEQGGWLLSEAIIFSKSLDSSLEECLQRGEDMKECAKRECAEFLLMDGGKYNGSN
jgi:hypothetical protein